MKIPRYVTKEFLRANPNVVFVFGDNLLRYGKGGAAKLRDEPNTYGFITKKAPNNKDESFYRLEEYRTVFSDEMVKLFTEIQSNRDKIYLISKIGSGLANKYNIYGDLIEPTLIKVLGRMKNVILMLT